MELLASDIPAAWLRLSAFVFGALWGSFFNVAIYRWPRDMSVVRPPSRCPHCETPIAVRYNVPIVGWLFLRGRSACCGKPLSPRYPLVELLSAIVCLAIVEHFVVQGSADATLLRGMMVALAYFCFAGGLIIATFVDLEHMEIPDEVSLPGAALGLVTAVFRDRPGAEAALLGAGGGYLVIQLLFVWTYEHLTGRRGMGEGDSKLLLMIGAFLGWQGVVFALFAGAAQGLIAYVITRVAELAGGGSNGPPAEGAQAEAHGGDEPEPEADDDIEEDDEPAPDYWGHRKLPFGPFLALGALEYLFFGEPLVDAWFRVVQGV